MASYLERQQNAFRGNIASALPRLSTTNTTDENVVPSLSPSPTSTASGMAPTAKMTPKRPQLEAGKIFSQPENTGLGESVLTQMTYVVDWLKGKDDPKTLQDVLGHLSATNKPEALQKNLAEVLQRNPRVQWIADPTLSHQTWRSGSYIHKPIIPNVRNETQLLVYLQQQYKQHGAQGVSVKDLKDGWPDCEVTLTKLEREHRVLVIRTKKDNHPRTVWLDDPRLYHGLVDDQFLRMWLKAELPGLDSIAGRLSAAGQRPTSNSDVTRKVQGSKVDKKKKRVTRRTGKATNTHMEHLLRDYSHLKR
jgi:transcription initiation factor TFIIE subunit beta